MRLLKWLMVICLLAVCGAGRAEAEAVEVTVLKTGKADAILICSAGQSMLIDTAEEENAEKLLELLEEKQIDRLDYLLITHLDKDHVGGAADVLKAVPVGAVYQCADTDGGGDYARFRKVCSRLGIEPILLQEAAELRLGSSLLRLLPAQKVYPDENACSVMAELFCGSTSFLFAGDAVGERLAEFLAEEHGPYTFLKVPHHGRMDAYSEEFLRAVRAQYAVITCSKKNPPDPEIEQLLTQLNTRIYLTMNGTVTVTSDGTKLELQQQR